MADWKELYKSKIVPAAEALKHISAGDRVFIGSACGEPQELVRALVQSSGDMTDTELLHVLTLGVAPFTDPKYAGAFRANAFFIGNSVRDAVNTARADYTPVFLSQVPNLFRTRRVGIDVAMVMVTPPDSHGFVSLGVSVDITRAAVDTARLVIAQVNDHMPFTMGNSFMHVDQIDYLVPHDEPLLEWPHFDEKDEVIEKIARHITRLVDDGSTLQLGIGRIPDSVAAKLTDKNDLGIHTEMFSDGVMKLANAGVVTGKYKTRQRGKIVGSFAAGRRSLFEWMDNNPMIEMCPSDYTNDPFIIAQHHKMIAINAALEVDLTGQVCADSIGEYLHSGIGGHADFIRGAALAKDGKPIIALPSTANTPDGVRSRIVATLQSGAGVVTTRGDTHYVVTEYGIAYLHGRTMRERAMSLINVAHPDFRSELLHAAKHRHIVYANQILPIRTQIAEAEYTDTYELRDGSETLIRPIRPDDESMIKDMFYSFSEQTVYLRFHHAMKSMPHNKLQMFCNVDFETEVALVALSGPPEAQEVVGIGRYFSEIGTQKAELAFVVRDDFQRKGLGTILFRRLVEIAKGRGISKFAADVLIENSGMLKIFHRSGMPIETTTESGVVHVEMVGTSDAPPPAKSRK